MKMTEDRRPSNFSTESDQSNSVTSRMNVGTILNPKTGTVMSREEVIAERTKNGMCISCGEVKTHKKRFGGLSMVPLNIANVVKNGTCVKCFNPQASAARNNMSRQSLNANFSPRTSILRSSFAQGPAKRGSSGSTAHRQSFIGVCSSDDSASDTHRAKAAIRQSLRGRATMVKQSFSSFDSNGSSKYSYSSKHRESSPSSVDSQNGYSEKNLPPPFPPKQITTSATARFRSKARMAGKVSKIVTILAEEGEHVTSDFPKEDEMDRRALFTTNASVHFNAVVKQKTFRNILDFERQNMEDGDEVAVALSELSKLAESEYSNKKIDELSSMIKILSRAVEFSNENTFLGEETCRLITVLAETGDDCRIRDLCSLGCGSILMSLMNSHSDNSEIISLVCTTLQNLTVTEEALKYLSERQLLRSFCKAIQNEKLEKETVQKVLDSIMMIFITPGKLQDMDAKLVIDSTVKAMEKDKNYDTYVSGFHIIHYVLDTFGGKYDLHDSFVQECMYSYPTELYFQHKGIQILTFIAVQSERFEPSDDLFEYLNDFIECEVYDNENSADLLSIHEEILKFYIELFSTGFTNSAGVFETKFIRKIHKLLDANINGSKQVLQKGLKLLSLSPSNKLNFTETRKSLGYLALIMDIYVDDDKIQIESFKLLQRLIQSEESSAQLGNANNIGIAKSIITNGTTSEQVIHTAFLSFYALCSFGSCREYLEQHEIMDAIASTMTRFIKNKDLQVSGIRILFKLSVHPETNIVPAISGDVMSTILQVMNEYSDNSIIQLNGCDLFKNALFQEVNIPIMQMLGEMLMERLLAASGTNPNCEQSAFSVMQIVFGG